MTAPIRRCAVYTRKSSEEGLEQSFNSLHAQREACEAYIRSQAHEGWKLVKTAYDDGGFSGGTMERPAVKRLMADLKQGLVDVVVVYKVDRLTRSLADFAKIVEILDGHGASFVSITQQFNTTSSMGRLTLNVLLSFAQFEREVTGERIRDKISASKRKGMWMGGNLPLGYDVQERQLVINEAEAETVRYIFRRYAELGTVSALQADLKQRGIVSKVWTSTTGNARGGVGYSRGALYYLLRNQIYLGRIAHKNESYDGQHLPIVDQASWDQVQTRLSANRSGQGRVPSMSSQSPLAGLLHDDRGNLMSPSHTKKSNGRRYRYYVSQALLQNDRARAGTVSRIPAEAIERLVDTEIRRLWSATDDLGGSSSNPAEVNLLPRDFVERVILYKDKVEIVMSEERLKKLAPHDSPAISATLLHQPKKLSVSVRLARRGRSGRLESSDGRVHDQVGRPDAAVVKAISRAHDWLGRFERGEVASYHELARAEGFTPGYIRSVMQLAFLAPPLVEAFLDGRRQLRGGVVELLNDSLPLSWQQQHASV
jgi:DNA invertase Pin-like site-specific DNA recombinase